MPNIGPLEIAVVLIIALVILGPKRLPEMGSSLGRGMREFKESISGAAPREPDHQADGKALEGGDGEKDGPRG